MILRNGINSTLRARGRSVLFTFLILILTISLTLGMGTWAYSSALLSQMDDTYTSIALVEYMGADYPNQDIADSYARAAAEALNTDAFQNIKGVQLWENTDRTLATVDGYTRMQGDVPYEDYGVLVCTSFLPVHTDGIVPYTESQLPRGKDLAITDYANWKARLFTRDVASPWVDLYLTDGEDRYYRYYTDPAMQEDWGGEYNAETGNIYFTKEQLPESFIVLIQNEYYSTYRYFLNGRLDFSLTKKRFNSDLVTFSYEAETDTYYGEGKIIRAYTGICVDPLYSREYDSDFLMTLVPDQQGLNIETGKRYVIHGIFSPDGNNHNNFVLVPFEDETDIPAWQEITDGTYDRIFDDYARKYEVANSFIRLEASKNVSALEVFQQNILHLQEGRFPAAGESGVCVITHDIAQQLNVSLGDTVDLTVLSSNADDRFELEGTEEKALEIVGIATGSEDHHGCVWVSDAEGSYTSPLFGYQLGQAVLDNATARQAADAIAALCGDNIRVTLYDQGYSAAAQPLQTMQTTATAVTVAAACGTVAVLLLFAFLFVGRQRETVQVLISLGTPKAKICLWLLSGAALICGISAVLGAIIGGASLRYIVRAALAASSSLYAADQRYSEAAIGFVKEALQPATVPLWPAIISAVVIFLLALTLCLVFLRLASKQHTPKRGKQTVRVPKSGTSTTGNGPLRFALLSAKRGGWRSVVVPVAALILSVLLGILSYGAQNWSAQIDTLYRDTKITGLTVSTNGRQDTGLLVPATSARALWKSDLLEDIALSIGWNYWLEDEIPYFGEGEFAEYRKEEWISKQPQIVALNSFAAAPEFMHGLSPKVTWIDGFDETFLSGNEYYSFMTTRFYASEGAILRQENEEIAYPCIVSQQFLNRRQLELGEEFYAAMHFKHYPWEEERYVKLYPVGVFEQTSIKANIYVPLSFWCDPDWITGQQDLLEPGERPSIGFRTNEGRDQYLFNTTNFATCVFTLKQASCLEQLRDYLTENKFSQVRNLSSNRTTILLRDQTFVETVDGLGRYISFSRLLFPVLFAVVALLGFIISWLMISGRRMEFAILRGLGASKVRVFLSFFEEQLALCLCGCILSALALLALTGFGVSQYVAILIFLVCYLSGCALSVIAVGKTNLMRLLSERE